MEEKLLEIPFPVSVHAIAIIHNEQFEDAEGARSNI